MNMNSHMPETLYRKIGNANMTENICFEKWILAFKSSVMLCMKKTIQEMITINTTKEIDPLSNDYIGGLILLNILNSLKQIT